VREMANKKQETTIDGSGAMIEDDGAGGGRQERVEGNGVDKGQQTTQINNQSLMGVANAGGNTAVKAKAVLVRNGAFCCRVENGGGRKVGNDGRAAVDNR
jgi:hypothetical protein